MYDYKNKLVKRREYLRKRIHFLDSIRIDSKYTITFPNTFPYNMTFDEIHKIDNELFNYVDEMCPVCNTVIGNNLYRKHHISYYPEKTILVHKKCHNKIHNTNEYPHLKDYNIGDSKDFYSGVKRQITWYDKGLPESIIDYKARANVYPKPTTQQIRWNRATLTEHDIRYSIIYYQNL